MAKVAVDDSGEVLAVWNDTVRAEDLPPGGAEDIASADAEEEENIGAGPRTGPRIGLPDMEGVSGVAEVVDLPDHDRESVAREADQKAGGKAGRTWLKGKIIEAEPAGEEPETAVEGALMKLRDEVRQRGGGKDAPLTAADIDRAIERERNKDRGGGRGGRQPRA